MSTWHAPQSALSQYAARPESVDELTALSIEAHLLGCAQCRGVVAAQASRIVVAASWADITDELDRPHRTIAERALSAFVPDHIARVVAATPALRLSWLAAVAAVVAAVVAFAHQVDTSTPFLILAPLIPLAGVGVSFAATADPAGEAALASPLFGAGLLLRRAATVLAMAIAVLVAGTLALPAFEWRHAGWLLPALALTFAALALSTWLSPVTATAAAAASWVLLVEVVAIRGSRVVSVADSVLFGAAGQLVFAVLAALGCIAFVLRSAHLRPVELR